MKSIFSVVLILAATVHLPAQAVHQVSGVDRAYLDQTISALRDFYSYANGAFDQVPIPAEYATYGVNQEIDERNNAILKQILEDSAKTGGPTGSVTQRVGDFYFAGMNEAGIEKAGVASLAPWFAEIAAIKTPAESVAVMGHLQANGLEAGFTVGVQIDDKDSSVMIASFRQGGLGLPDRDDYFREGAEAEEIRHSYSAHVAAILTLSGTDAESAQREADAIMALETKLAHGSRTLVELQDSEKNYHKVERNELNKLAPDFAWEDFLTQLHFPAEEKAVLIGQPEFFITFSRLLHAEPIATWRAYLRWHLLNQTVNFLNETLVAEHFAFYGKKLSGITELKPRWKRVLAAADTAIGEDLGQLYVKTAFSPAAKEKALAMFRFHLIAMRGRIRAAKWMSAPTKAQAYKKIATMRSKIGYPEHWRDYRALTLTRDSYVGNAIAASTFEFQRQLAKLGKPVDRHEWLMTPQTNNSYYEPSLNEVCFPAGILQPPFFDEHADDATNYGALASTLGHELTHAFDDQGRQYDSDGNLNNWWTDEEVRRFTERAELIAAQYDAFEVEPGLHLNGHQTLSENIADVCGLRVSYEAYKLATAGKQIEPINGFTPEQRFFVAFAQGWRTNQRPEEVMRRVNNDVHSPARWRVLGPIANFPEFRAAFGDTEPKESWPPIW